MAYPVVSINQQNNSQGGTSDVERTALFVGLNDENADSAVTSTVSGTLHAIGAGTNLDDILGAADSNLKDQINAAKECGAPVIELHTGHYADAMGDEQEAEFERIKTMATYAHSIGLQVNAGHGLTMENTTAIAELPEIIELNIGHSIIARAVFIGLEAATREMKDLMLEARI